MKLALSETLKTGFVASRRYYVGDTTRREKNLDLVVLDKVMLKPACLATETSLTIDILHVAN